MFNKKIVALGMAAALTAGVAQADVLDNDVDQFAVSNAQTNIMLDLAVISLGPLVFDGTNSINVVDYGINNANDDARFNDVTQVAAFNSQRNALLTANGLDVGRTVFRGTNVINHATVSIDALDDVDDNDITQAAAHNIQTNDLVALTVVDLGRTKFVGSNIANYADWELKGSQPVAGNTEEVDFNDLRQAAFDLTQANRMVVIEGINLGRTIFDGTNVINYAEAEIDAEDADLNDINQDLLGDTIQYNVLVLGQGLSGGKVDFKGANIANYADWEIDLVFGGKDGNQVAFDNDIDQDAQAALQVNAAVRLAGGGLGRVVFDGQNVVNHAALDIDTAVVENHSLVGNDIRQSADKITQVNALGVGQVIQIGAVKFEGANFVNNADLKLRAVGTIAGNDVSQLATGISQTNAMGVATLGHAGAIKFSGANAINSAKVSIAP